MPTNDFLPGGIAFANDASAIVTSQEDWVNDASGGLVQFGFPAGIVQETDFNKAVRQPSVMVGALAQFIVNQLGENVLDSGGPGSVTTLISQIQRAIQAAAAGGQPPLKPQGRLTPTTGTPVIGGDVISATEVFYTGFEGNVFPVWNGTEFIYLSFAADLPLVLTGAASANAIVDVFGFSNGGVATIGFGPVWANSTPGSSARGTGAGTTELQRVNGLWTNKNIITLLNGADTFSNIAVNQATYLGSLGIDGSAGQVTCHVSFGQSRKFGVWNAYNRKPIYLRAGDSTASWSVGAGPRPANNNAANSLKVLTGLAEEFAMTQAFLRCTGTVDNNNNEVAVGIGLNSTTAFTSFSPSIGHPADTSIFNLASLSSGSYPVPPSLGLNTITILEKLNSGAPTASGGEANMLLSAMYLG